MRSVRSEDAGASSDLGSSMFVLFAVSVRLTITDRARPTLMVAVLSCILGCRVVS